MQPEPTTLGQLWDGSGYGAGGKPLSLGKLLEKQQKLLCKLSQTEKHCRVYFKFFVLLLLITLSKYIPLMDAAREEAHTSSCERVPVPISLFPSTINWSYKRCYSSLPLLNNSVPGL